MSLIIKGMELPKSCDVCPFVGTNDDLRSDDYRYLYCCFPYMGQFVTDYEATRHPDCPLLPLPEKHGRLIDADALGDFPYNISFCDEGDVENWIASAHTIIQAEGGGEDGKR